MKYLLLSIISAFLLSGCLAQMEKVTSDTRDSVEETKKGAQLATALEILHNDAIDDMAMRSAVAETVFMLAADDRIHKYLGCRLPLTIGADPETKQPNVTRVYGQAEYGSPKPPPIYPGLSAPKSPVVYAIIEHAALTVLNELAQVASKDLPTDKLEEYKLKAKKMIPIATAILGARAHSDRDHYYRDLVPVDSKNKRGEPVKLKSLDLRTEGASLLRTVTVKYSLDENDVNALRVLMSERMGIDFNLID